MDGGGLDGGRQIDRANDFCKLRSWTVSMRHHHDMPMMMMMMMEAVMRGQLSCGSCIGLSHCNDAGAHVGRNRNAINCFEGINENCIDLTEKVTTFRHAEVSLGQPSPRGRFVTISADIVRVKSRVFFGRRVIV